MAMLPLETTTTVLAPALLVSPTVFAFRVQLETMSRVFDRGHAITPLALIPEITRSINVVFPLLERPTKDKMGGGHGSKILTEDLNLNNIPGVDRFDLFRNIDQPVGFHHRGQDSGALWSGRPNREPSMVVFQNSS